MAGICVSSLKRLEDVFIKHVMVTNESACYEEESYISDCIITTYRNDGTIVLFAG